MIAAKLPSQSAHNLNPKSSNQTTFNRLLWLNTLLWFLILIGSLFWREIQLHAAQQLIRDCVENNSCSNMTETLETLIQAQKNLKLLALDHANLEAANLKSANLYRTNLSHANLEAANLKSANLYRTNLSHANLEAASLKSANLFSAILINTQHLTSTQIKSACNWEAAFYQGRFDDEYKEWIIDLQGNQQFIEQLQQDKDSDPKKAVNCSKWE